MQELINQVLNPTPGQKKLLIALGVITLTNVIIGFWNIL